MILQQHQPVSRDRHHYHRIRSDLLRQSLATQRKDIRPLEEARTWSHSKTTHQFHSIPSKCVNSLKLASKTAFLRKS
ncbi:hypothetical protein DTO166G4_4481 [Paecilomyces variotii]|nr:hypothetical protein DTO166G4_4481 [Paecilomyces variotii]KAJ9240078.1 hypothetical protein DTO166G5_1943 [Paecilomyces variotii]KAJ9253084.1 hypothetical protein DTO207G8_4385 [Paecilomyces variotii]